MRLGFRNCRLSDIMVWMQQRAPIPHPNGQQLIHKHPAPPTVFIILPLPFSCQIVAPSRLTRLLFESRPLFCSLLLSAALPTHQRQRHPFAPFLSQSFTTSSSDSRMADEWARNFTNDVNWDAFMNPDSWADMPDAGIDMQSAAMAAEAG